MLLDSELLDVDRLNRLKPGLSHFFVTESRLGLFLLDKCCFQHFNIPEKPHEAKNLERRRIKALELLNHIVLPP